MKKRKSAFTLIESIITILIIAILAVVLMVSLNASNQRAQEAGVDVDFHTYYVAAKSAILSSQDGELSTRDGFVEKCNEYLDKEMKIKGDLMTCTEKDPWNSNYRFFYYVNNAGSENPEYYVAFTSTGYKPSDTKKGWIFEPDRKSNEKKYSREGYNTSDNQYILVLGYSAGDGILIEEEEKIDKNLLTEILKNPDLHSFKIDGNTYYLTPSDTAQNWVGTIYNTDDCKISNTDELVNSSNYPVLREDATTVMKDDVINDGDVYHTVSGLKYVMLQFSMEEDDGKISIDSEYLPEDSSFLYFYSGGSGGSGGYIDTGGTGGYAWQPFRDGYFPGGGSVMTGRYPNGEPWASANVDYPYGNEMGLWSWVQMIYDQYPDGEFNKDHIVYAGTHGGMTAGFNSAAGGTGATGESIDLLLNSEGYTRVVSTSNEGGEEWIHNDITMGGQNKIRISFKASDKLNDECNWYKVGSTITLKALPAKNYEFVFWRVNGEVYSTNDEITLTVNEDTSFTAKFKQYLKVNGGGRLTTKSGKLLSEYNVAEKNRVDAIKDEAATALWTYTVDGSTAKLTSYKGPSGSGVNLTVPNKINGYTVTTVDGSCYSTLRNKTFNNVTIEDGINLVNNGSAIFDSAVINNLYIGKNVQFDTYEGYANGKYYIWTFLRAKINNLELHSNPQINAFRETSLKTLKLGSEVTSIGTSAFRGNSISNIPDLSNVESIGDNAFYSGIIDATGNLNIKASASVGISAFNSCKMNINSLTVNEGATIKGYAFSSSYITIENLKINDNVNIPNDSSNNKAFDSTVINNLYIGKNVQFDTYYNDRNYTTFLRAKINNLEIHSNTSSHAFRNTNLKNLKIGSEVTSIGNNAFSGNSISNIPDLSNVESIGTSAFSSSITDATGDLTIKASATVGESAFRNCTMNIGNLDVGTGATLGYSAFNSSNINVDNLKINDNVNMPNRSYSYDGAFSYTTINNLYIGKNVSFDTYTNDINYRTFNQAKINNLELYSNPSSHAFRNTNLKNLKIGSEVSSIGASAFSGNSALTEAEIFNTEGNVTIGSNAFPSTTSIIYRG